MLNNIKQIKLSALLYFLCLHTVGYANVYESFDSFVNAPHKALGRQTTLSKQASFDFSPLAKDTYQKISRLRFAEGREGIRQLKASAPNNAIAPFLESYLDFLTAMIEDTKVTYNQFTKNMSTRIDQIARADRNSPYHLYCQAEMRLQRAVLYGRNNDFLAGFSDIKQAYSLLENNQRRFPDFVANKKSLGILHALVGNIPDEFQWVVRTAGGMRGDVQQGLREIEAVLQYARSQEYLFEEETGVAYAFLLIQLGAPNEQAWKTLQGNKLNPNQNPLSALALASLAMRVGHNDDAIQLLTSCPSGEGWWLLPQRHFLLGLAKLYRLDQGARYDLERFNSQFKGQYTKKEGLQKLAWHHLINGDAQGYNNAMAQIKNAPGARSDNDKVAEREAQSGEIPDVTLLKARLLFDGGYYQRAYDLLKNMAGQYSSHRKNSLEYAYRMGRITHKLQKTAEAIRYYQQTSSQGASEPWYFSCNAALQLGLLYEEQKQWANARTAFERCLGIRPEEYRAGLHAKAKAGLSRIKGR
jgi:hypothetical protein